METISKEDLILIAELGTNRKGWKLTKSSSKMVTLELLEEYRYLLTTDRHVVTINLQTNEVEYLMYTDCGELEETLHPGFRQAGLDYLNTL